MTKFFRDIYIPETIYDGIGAVSQEDAFSKMMQLKGKAFRNVPGRKTSQVTLNGEAYFIKQHFGVGWLEIFKNWLSFKKPVLGALTEVSAIRKMSDLGILTTPIVAYGKQGLNPARQQSFLLTKDLGDITSLEELCQHWLDTPPSLAFKHALIIAVAKLAAKIHRNGVNHRDFYLCHLCVDTQVALGNLTDFKLYLIDLHRVLIHEKPNQQANMKDIAALYFSAMDIGLDNEDLALFKAHYNQQSSAFWRQVERRASKLHQKFNSKKFQTRLEAEREKLKE